MKKITILLIFTALIMSMQLFAANDVSSFKQDYEKVQKDFELALKTIKTREAYNALRETRNENYKKVYQKYENLKPTDPVEIIRGKILIKLRKYNEASKKIDPIIKKKSKWYNDAMMTKIHLYFAQMKINEALAIFRKIENNVKPDYDVYQAYLYFAMLAKDTKDKLEYTEKFLSVKNLPKDLSSNTPYLLSAKAKIFLSKDKKKAFKIYAQALEAAKSNPRVKRMIESEISQAKFIGSKAPSISAKNWINSTPLSLDKLQGKVVIIDFWATWCSPCRAVIPVLVEQYKKYKDKGLVVIGFTKLYGSYRDDKMNKGKVPADVELKLIADYVKTRGIPYPIAVAKESTIFQKYQITGIPTMIFIDKKGNIHHIKVGSGSPDVIRNKIKKLLAE